MIAFLLAAASPPTAVDSERAFATDAHKLGQRTALREGSSDCAAMFTPQPVNAHELLSWSSTVAADPGGDFTALLWDGHACDLAASDRVKGE